MNFKDELILLSANSLMEAKSGWIEKQATGNIIGRIQNDIYSLSESITQNIPNLMKKILFIIILI